MTTVESNQRKRSASYTSRGRSCLPLSTADRRRAKATLAERTTAVSFSSASLKVRCALLPMGRSDRNLPPSQTSNTSLCRHVDDTSAQTHAHTPQKIPSNAPWDASQTRSAWFLCVSLNAKRSRYVGPRGGISRFSTPQVYGLCTQSVTTPLVEFQSSHQAVSLGGALPGYRLLPSFPLLW